jgi:hypothetical protein
MHREAPSAAATRRPTGLVSSARASAGGANLQFDIEAYDNATQNTITVTHTSATNDKVQSDSLCTTG